ncbi:hypothetical protein J6590_007370 [Homalodisca vitripennis]|nr:hypothetical protein J6590_007370 [Homalodisca vitripennis]
MVGDRKQTRTKGARLVDSTAWILSVRLSICLSVALDPPQSDLQIYPYPGPATAVVSPSVKVIDSIRASPDVGIKMCTRPL